MAFCNIYETLTLHVLALYVKLKLNKFATVTNFSWFQLILELCRPEQTIHLKTIQPHLDIITSLFNTEVHLSSFHALYGYYYYMAPRTNQHLYYVISQISDTRERESASNLLGLIHTLIKDQEERQHFFQVSVSGSVTLSL